jgi:hypothetical protein
VWKHRNLIIFEDSWPNLSRVCNKIFQDVGETKMSTCHKVCRVDRPPLLHLDMEVGFFVDASQDMESKCGVRVVLKCPIEDTFRIKMNCGKGTNTTGQLLALWCILFFSFYKKITILQLVGDSKVTIDWFKNANTLQVASLQRWTYKVGGRLKSFS